jgi:hypothetical protein
MALAESNELPIPSSQLFNLTTRLVQSWQNTRAPFVDTEVGERIAIAQVYFCCNSSPGCPSPTTEPHLVVDYQQVPIARESGVVAISYTWGEFKRRMVLIGHRSPHSGVPTPVRIELGVEWNTQDLQKCLVGLCEKHDGIWLDQLCNGQTPQEVDTILAEIPTIYRSLDVVAIMPGASCECLHRMTDKVIEAVEAGTMTHEQIEAIWHDELIQKSRCLHFAGLNSWFDRLWTRQEFTYSRRITVLRTSKTLAPCVGGNVDRLEGFSYLLYERIIREGCTAESAFKALQIANSMYLGNAMDAMTAYCGYGNPEFDNQINVSAMLSYFLRGDTIENPQFEVSRDDISARLKNFFYQLGILGQSARKATKQRDYVIAVWVDCPGYKKPSGWRDKPFAELLEDAILQLERNFGVSPVSNTPAGLFGNRQEGGLWRPTTYIGGSTVRDARELYGVLTRSHHVYVFEGSIPISSIGQHDSLSVSSRSASYERVFEGYTTSEVFTKLCPVVAEFPIHILRRIAVTDLLETRPARTIMPPGDHLLDDMFAGYLLEPYMPDRSPSLPAPRGEWGALPEVDHHNIMRKIVAAALGLPADVYGKFDLDLVVSLETPPCIGLFKRSVVQALHRLVPSLDQRIRTSHVHGSRFTTLSMARDTFTVGCSLLETAFVNIGPPAILEVVGIWVPIKHTSFDDLQGVALPYARDARLGGPLVGRNYQDGDELLRYVLHDLPRDVNAEVRLHKNREPEGEEPTIAEHNPAALMEADEGKKRLYPWLVAGLGILMLGALWFSMQEILRGMMWRPKPAYHDTGSICIVGPEYWRVRTKAEERTKSL